MNEDELKSSLESLFSDVSAPPPAPEGAEVEPEEGVAGAPADVAAAPEVEAPPAAEGFKPEEAEDEAEAAEEAGVAPLPEEITDWRGQLLQVLTYVGAAVGLPVVLLYVYDAYVSGRLILAPFWLASYVILLLITFVRRIPHSIRAGTFLSLMFGVSLFDLVSSGPTGNHRMLLLSIPALTVALLSRPAGMAALLVVSLTQAVSTWAVSTNRFIPLRQRTVVSGAPGRWWSGPVVFVLAATGLLIAQSGLIPRLAGALKRIRKLGRDLAEYQARVGGQRRELRRRALQLEAGVEIGQAITSVSAVDELLDRTVELIPDYFGCYFAGIFLLDEIGEGVVLRTGTGEVGAQMAAEGFRLEVDGRSVVGWTARHRVSYVALDAENNERYRPHPLLPTTGSEVALPIVFNGDLLGVLDVRARETMAFDETDIRVFRGIADQLAVAIQNARHMSREAPLLEATSALYRASRRLTRAKTVDEVADAVVDSVDETEADGCLVVEFVRSPDGALSGLRCLSTWREQGQPWLRPGAYVPLAESPFPAELVEGSWVVADVEKDERLSSRARDLLVQMGVKALVSLPLRAGDDTIGQLVVLSGEPDAFSGRSMQLYEMLGEEAARAFERALLLEEARSGAHQEWKLRRVVDRIRRAADMEQALRAAAGELSNTMDVPRVSIELDVNPEDESESEAPGSGD